MATVALAYSQPRPTLITSHYQRGGSESWSNLVRVPVGDLPSGDSEGYSVVAFGHMGRFTYQASTYAAAMVALRFDNSPESHIATTLQRVPLYADPYLEGHAMPNRGVPFCLVANITAGNWSAGDDLVLSATMEHTGSSPPIGSFFCDAMTVLVFGHNDMTVVHNSFTTPTILPYSDVSDVLLVDGTTIPSAEDWCYFYSVQVAPGTELGDPANPYWCWLSRYNDGVNLDVTEGISGRFQTTGFIGKADRGAPPVAADPLFEMYNCGGWWPITTTNATTKVQCRGFSFYAAATAIHRAQMQSAHMFAVPLAAMSDATSERLAVVPNAYNVSAWENYQTLSIDAGDDRTRFCAIAQSTLYDSTEPTVISGANHMHFNGGFPATKFPANCLNTTVTPTSGIELAPNFCSHVADNPPWLVRYGQNTAQTQGILNVLGGYSADAGGQFYAAFAFCTTDDPDRTPPTPRTISYTAITLTNELDIAVVPELTDDLLPDEGLSITVADGLRSFETEDGHVIRWPMWSRARRIWRFRWVCDEARYAALFALIHRPFESATIKLPTTYYEAPGVIVSVQPNTLRAEQRSGRLVWEVSCVATELVYTP